MGRNVGSQHWKSNTVGLLLQAVNGCSKEKISGTARGRPALEKLIDHLRNDDVFVVARLDRLARSTIEILHIGKRVIEKHAGLQSPDESGTIRRRRPA